MHVRITVAFLGLAGLLAAQDASLVSGPEKGARLQPAMVYAAAGGRRGQEFDAAAAIGQGPGALLFIHEITRNVAPMIRGLDQLASEYAPLGFKAFSIRVAADRTQAESQIARVSRALHLAHPITVSIDGAEGPGDYALNRKCTLTLVFAKAGRVQRSIGLTDTGRQDTGKLRSWIEEVTGHLPHDRQGMRALLRKSLPTDPAALRERVVELTLQVRRLQQQLARASQRGRGMRGGRAQRKKGRMAGREGSATSAGASGARRASGRRRGGPPSDAKLLSLLRRVIRKTADQAELDEIFGQIDRRVGKDADLSKQARDMFLLMLSYEKYGNAKARQRAQAYLDAHRPTKRM